MTESRLNELINKSKTDSITNEELFEVLAATLQSVSRHSKDIKSKLDDIDKKINTLMEETNESFFGRIIEEPDQDWSGLKSDKLKLILKAWSVSKLAYVDESIW